MTPVLLYLIYCFYCCCLCSLNILPIPQVICTNTANQQEQQENNASRDTLATPAAVIQIDEWEIDSYKAIKTLHSKLDVDRDGEVDNFESKKFLDTTSKQVNEGAKGATVSKSNEKKLDYLHKDDPAITVDELWLAWKKSQAHNWTVEDTINWLTYAVELPEYSETFRQRNINGSVLPQIAADHHVLSKMGITEPAAKSRISIKAMDVVLFGPPKLGGSSKMRDFVVTVIILIAMSSCGVFYSRSLATQRELRYIQDSKLEALHKAEAQMSELQQELNKALKAQEAAASEKKNLEHQLEMHRQYSGSNLSAHGVKGNKSSLDAANSRSASEETSDHEQYINKLEQELKSLRKELQGTCDAIAAKSYRAPQQLRLLLQATYNMESQYFKQRKMNLESKAAEAKMRNQKLQKKKASLLGFYKMAQENSVEEGINTIVELKESLMQITREIKEQTDRWRAIEELCGCSLDLTPLSKIMAATTSSTESTIRGSIS